MPSTREFAGLLNVTVTLESPSETGGDGTVTWTTVDTVWAQMLGTGGSELSGLEADATYQFRLYYRSDVTARWRIGLVGTTRKLQIIAPPQDPTGRRERLLISAREIV